MYKAQGGCHCGNIVYTIEMQNEPSSYNPRACDCRLCTMHGASYISDKEGDLKIKIKNKMNLNEYKQGSGISDFLICKNCGVMVAVCYEEKGCIYCSVNTKTVCDNNNFGEIQLVSPKQLTDVERIKRWKAIWFSNVQIEYEGP